ncbi:MAG: hypothetical protein QM820_11845 [Minicystis sp.]
MDSVPRRALALRADRAADADLAPDAESVARWAAWYEALPDGLREALDELGHGTAKRDAAG